jgi:hypothetical protein
MTGLPLESEVFASAARDAGRQVPCNLSEIWQ